MRLEDKVAMVTGAAAGQGRDVAKAWAREGAAILVLDIDEGHGVETAEMIRSDGGVARFFSIDVSSESDWIRIAASVAAEFGRVDVLYNNAALFSPNDGPATEIDVETWDRVFAVNVRGVFLGCKHVVPLMEQDGGSIVNVASIRAWLGTSKAQDAYAATKGAVVALSRSLSVHLAPARIRVNTLCPGTILTDMAPLPDDAAVAERLARYPIGRFGLTSDVLGAATYLASDESLWVTGTELIVDGGTSALYV